MRVTVEYTAQLKAAAGVPQETFEIQRHSATVWDLLDIAISIHGDALRALLVSEGNVKPHILICRNQVRVDAQHSLSDGDTIWLLGPISGG